jgi:hypothetical protein
MLKEKARGFKFLFSDRTIMGTSIITFCLALTLELIPFLDDVLGNGPIFIIGIITLIIFEYTIWFIIIFDVFLLFGNFRDNRRKKRKKGAMWAVRMLTIVVLIIGNVLFFASWTFIHFWLIIGSFLVWSAIASFYFCKLAYELSDFTRHKVLRLFIYLILVVGYLVYLVISLRLAQNSSSPPSPGDEFILGIDKSLFDLILNLVLFFFTIASQGERFMPAGAYEKLDFDHLSWKQEAKIKNSLMFLFMILIGFEIYLQGLNFLFSNQFSLLFGSITFYLARMIFFVPIAIGFFIAVLVNKAGKQK